MKEKPWKRNGANLIIVSSIFAALAGLLLVYVLQDNDIKRYWILPTIFLLLSFFLFAWSAEEITTAMDEEDVRKFVFILLFYNSGVVLLFLGLAFIIIFKFEVNIWLGTIITVLILRHPWLKDLSFLLFKNKEFELYIYELDGVKEPEKDPYLLMKLFYKTKDKKKNIFPHNNVYTRLGQSEIHGIGVFAIRNIPKGTNIFRNDTTRMIWIERDNILNIGPELQRLYDDFCVIKNDKYGCPENFNSLTVGWYINESKNNPNVYADKYYDFISIREIKKGEELLANYSEYSQ